MSVQGNLVDVIINVYGKPWQTLCTLKSLLKHSGDHIDKIYFIEEAIQPKNEDISEILSKLEKVIHYKPYQYQFLPNRNSVGDLSIDKNRFVFRYQYGIEKSDKKYVFITHNDVLYTGDIIGQMLSNITGFGGVGLIGQCWNCPASSSGNCNGKKIYEYNPTYEDIIQLTKQYQPARGEQFIRSIDKNNPMPLPECRLNEFACLIDREMATHYKNDFFGSYDGLDLGCGWFRNLTIDGIKFKNYNIEKNCIHGFWANTCGYQVQLNSEKYQESERVAKQYYIDNFEKQKKVFIDGGARVGESFDLLLNDRLDMVGCDLYFFECNPNHIETLENIKKEKTNYNIIVKNNAIWNKNEEREFYITNDRWGDLGCTLKKEKMETKDMDHPIIVKCIDVSEFIGSFSDNDYIILKLDIEGAEYEVLDRLIETGEINKIDELFVEFHDGFFNHNRSIGLKNTLKNYNNIKLNFEWQ